MTKVIWPTTRGWVICIGGILWMLVAMINHTLFAMLLAWACISLTAASFLSALFSLFGIRVSRADSCNVTAGQLSTMPLRIENSFWRRRQSIIVEEKMPFALEETAIHVLPPMRRKSTRFFERQVLAVKRGEFTLQYVLLRSGDPAGLFCRERRFNLPASLIVYPPVEQLPDLLLHQHEAFQSATGDPISAAGTSQDFYGVREYTPSDGMRYIHWRSSARYRKFMVKEFERNAVMSVAVLLDGNEQMVSGKGWSNLEYLIRVAASLNAYCADLYCTFSFVAGGALPLLIPPKLASETRREVMYQLATLRPGNVRLPEMIDEIAAQLPKNTVVFCLSLSDENLQLRQSLENLVAMGMDVRWYCASRAAFSGKQRKREGVISRNSNPYGLHTVQIAPEMSIGQVMTAT